MAEFSFARRQGKATGAKPKLSQISPRGQDTELNELKSQMGTEGAAEIQEVLTLPGQPLEKGTRSFMEPRFGHRFEHIRIHSDSWAAQSARSLGADAYTLQNHIVFGENKYSPQDSQGKALLAHELAHTIQQSRWGASASPACRLELSQPKDFLEQEADGIASMVVSQCNETVCSEPWQPRASSPQTAVQRKISPDYPTIKKKLTPAAPVVVSEDDAHDVLMLLKPLSDTDLADTEMALDKEGLLDTFLGNLDFWDRVIGQSLLKKLDAARNRSQTKTQQIIAVALANPVVLSADALAAVLSIESLPQDQRRVIALDLEGKGQLTTLLSALSPADRTAHSVLISELEFVQKEYTDRMLGTSIPDAIIKGDVEAQLKAGTGVAPTETFVDPLPTGNTYKQDIEDSLDATRVAMVAEVNKMFARPKEPMKVFEDIGDVAKAQVDKLYGHYKQGPPFRSTGSKPNLVAGDSISGNAPDMTDYLIHTDRRMRPVHQAHKAIPSRPKEKKIIAGIIPKYSKAHKADLILMDRGWPGQQGGGKVWLQAYEGATATETRKGHWRKFQTMMHEYLHSVTHEHYVSFARTLTRSEGDVLIEGGTSLYTDKVWNTVFPNEIRANDPLRLTVEGKALPFDRTVIPDLGGYTQMAQARAIEGLVGEANMRGAYFLGHVELLGLGSQWKPKFAAQNQIFIVPSGVKTLADVATACNVPESDIASANGLAVGDKVKRGDKLLVLGIRLYVVDVNDYLGRIAKVNGVSETALKRANPHYNWSKMYYGDTVIIPAH